MCIIIVTTKVANSSRDNTNIREHKEWPYSSSSNILSGFNREAETSVIVSALTHVVAGDAPHRVGGAPSSYSNKRGRDEDEEDDVITRPISGAASSYSPHAFTGKIMYSLNLFLL